jgi:hypothetical protein
VTSTLRVILEIGPKRRVAAGAMDWPGLDRWGTSEDDVLDKLRSYVPRYLSAATRAGLGTEFERSQDIEIVERVTGSSSTDWWGVAHIPSQIEDEALTDDALERRLALLQACWDEFDQAVRSAPDALTRGPRGGGRSRDEIVRHVYWSERHNWWRKVGLRHDDDVRLTSQQLAAYRAEYVDAIRAHNAEGRKARRWPIQFLIRRTAQHAMDHAWEIEDRTAAT